MKMRIMTYNIAGGRDYSKTLPAKIVTPSAFAEVIKRYSPDLVGLNEVDFNHPRSGNIDLAREIGSLTGHASLFSKAVVLGNGEKRGDYGNACLYRVPMLSHETIIVPDPIDKSEPTYYETRAVLHETVLFGDKEVEVIITHFGLAKTERMESMKIITKLIEERKHPLILMGDFNVRPNSEEIAPLFKMLKDTFVACENQNDRTFPSRFDIPGLDEPSKNDGKGIKIDYIFVSEEFGVDKVIISDATASDHRAYIADLTL
ncbi:MAG: endonuclease/exonuclease/phosphatase family protein [Eubacteriales bacterium]